MGLGACREVWRQVVCTAAAPGHCCRAVILLAKGLLRSAPGSSLKEGCSHPGWLGELTPPGQRSVLRGWGPVDGCLGLHPPGGQF